jgi:Fe2+ or Zn2+ uptake regulation protein
MEQKVSEIQALMISKGYKFTRSRKIMTKLFVTTRDHLKPEDVYRLTKDQNISLPTVYRNLDLMLRLGVIKEIAIHHERFYELDLYSRKKLHIHFQCSRCGQIKEYSNPEVFRSMIEQRDYLESFYGDDIDDITIVMTGMCSDCKQTVMQNLG